MLFKVCILCVFPRLLNYNLGLCVCVAQENSSVEVTQTPEEVAVKQEVCSPVKEPEHAVSAESSAEQSVSFFLITMH